MKILETLFGLDIRFPLIANRNCMKAFGVYNIEDMNRLQVLYTTEFSDDFFDSMS